MPIEFADGSDYDKIYDGDTLEIDGLLDAIKDKDEVSVTDKTSGFEFVGKLNLSDRDREILLTAGLLSYTKAKAKS